MNKIRILIADDIEETRDLLKKVITLDNEHFEIVGEAGDGEEAIKLCKKLLPDIVLMDINMPKKNGLEATEIITSRYPECDVIIMSVQSDTEYLKTAMVAGAKGYILKPINHEEVSELIQKTFDKKRDRRQLHSTVVSKKEGKIVSFYSFKGGVGKSILSLNSSILLAKQLKQKVLLIDLDLHFGDISLLTNKHLEKTILDLVDDNMTDNFDAIKQYLFNYCENVDVLFAPLSPEGADYISKDIIKNIIGHVKNFYDVIIIDTGVNFDEHTLYVLDISNLILFVSSMEMSSLKNSKLGLGVMKSLNYDDEKVKIVINQASEKFGVSRKDIEKIFEREIHTFIDEDSKGVRLSVNRGSALCLDSKNKGTKFCKSLLGMCKKII